MVEALLALVPVPERAASLAALDNDGHTPLILAVSWSVHNSKRGNSRGNGAHIVPAAVCERLVALGALTSTVDRRGKTAHWHLLRFVRDLFDGIRSGLYGDAEVYHHDCVKISEALSVGAPSEHPIAEGEAIGDWEIDDYYIHFDYEDDFYTDGY